MALLDFLNIGTKIIDKLIPDPAAKAAAQLELAKLQQAGEFKEIEANLQIAQQQTDINKIEAASDSLFKSGWRPFLGWVGGGGFAYITILQPLLVACGVHAPVLDGESLMTLITGMLGFGGMRSFEKYHGVHKD